MKSKSKFEVDESTIRRLFDKAGISNTRNIEPLGAGEYNSVYSVDAGDGRYAVKIAPADTSKALTYERDMLAQELHYYDLMANQAGIRVPKVFYADESRGLIPASYFIMERLEGQQLDQWRFSSEEQELINGKLAAMVAKMHRVRGDRFGYRQNGLHDDWYKALRSMVINLLNDAKRFGKRSRKGERLLGYVDRNQTILEKVECQLINFDIWPPNIFCSKENGEFSLAWIDPERCLWGDPIADFVCLDFGAMSLDKKAAVLEHYNATAEKPIVLGDEERIRLALMLGYLSLIMEVEKYPRYSHAHFGYWRNVHVCRLLYRESFRQLKELSP